MPRKQTKTAKRPPRMSARKLKAGGFTNGLWRLEERKTAAQARKASRDLLPPVTY